jgi:hypothetical protein
MADIVLVVVVLAFLALCVVYVHASDRIVASTDDETTGEVTR